MKFSGIVANWKYIMSILINRNYRVAHCHYRYGSNNAVVKDVQTFG